jgi:Fe-S oxidoreductase
MDEGRSKMALADYAGDMNMCCRCNACKFIPLQQVKGFKHANVCPSISRYNFHFYAGGGRVNMGAAELREGEGFEYSPWFIDSIYNCVQCGACDVSCKYGMDMEVLRPIQEIRIKAVEDGHAHPALEKVVARMRATGSMVPTEGVKRGDWAQGLGLTDATKEKVDVLYHVGCLTSYDKDMQRLAKATARVLGKAGVAFGIAGDAETCCGGRSFEMGHKADFLAQAAKSMEVIKQSGAKTLVTSCATCYMCYSVLYDRFDLKGDLEVLHTSQLMARLIDEGKLKPQAGADLNVTYHDPCHLGRLGEPWVHWEGTKVPGDRFVFDPPKPYRRGTNGVYEPPRDVIRSLPGVTLTEMDRIKEYAWCSGSCGGVTDSNPEFAEWTAAQRLEEAACTGAEAIVSASPWSEKLFADTIAKRPHNLRVLDIVELAAQAL